MFVCLMKILFFLSTLLIRCHSPKYVHNFIYLPHYSILYLHRMQALPQFALFCTILENKFYSFKRIGIEFGDNQQGAKHIVVLLNGDIHHEIYLQLPSVTLNS